jgi:hypothetical protein
MANHRGRLVSGAVLSLVVGLTGVPPAAGASAGRVAAASPPPPPVLYSGTVLFVDGHRIAATGNVKRDYIQGTKVRVDDLPSGRIRIPPVERYLGADPEADAADGDQDIDNIYLMGAGTVIREHVDGKLIYRMWLRSGSHTGYRESDDGLHWRVRDADSVIVAPGVTDASVVKDPHTGLYYLIGWSRELPGYVEMVSEDGINFTNTTDFVGLLSQLTGDVVAASTDPASRNLVAIAKQKSLNGRVCDTSPEVMNGGRTFGTHVSQLPSEADAQRFARSWRVESQPLTSDCVDTLSVPPVADVLRPAQLYGMPFQRYGDQFIGFPWFFQVTAPHRPGEGTGYADGPVDTQIASTPDISRVPWQRADPVARNGSRKARPTLIPRGPDGAWDDGMIYGQSGLVDLGDRMALYYTGWNNTHRPVTGRKARMGAATWRKDGFLGLKVVNPRQRGWMKTRPFRLPATAGGRTLYVNAKLNAGRNLRVGVLDGRTGAAIPGFRASDSTVVTGDKLAARVTWRKGRRLGVLRSRSIRLVFTYSAGSLYSFRVG